MKTLCYSVRVESFIKISDKAYKAYGFDGSEAIIPASQVFGQDYEVIKSEAWWISAWILQKKDLQYSTKKSAWFDEQRHKLPSYEVKHHTPSKVDAVDNNIVESLKKD